MDYRNILVVTPLPRQPVKGSFVPEADSPGLDIAMETVDNTSTQDIAVHSSRIKFLPDYRNHKHHNPKATINTTHSGRILRNNTPMNEEQEVSFGKQSTKQRAHTSALLREGKLDY